MTHGHTDARWQKKKKPFFRLKVWGTVVATVSGLTPHKIEQYLAKLHNKKNP